MIANVKLEGTVNRIVTINGERFEAFDGSFVYAQGAHCDEYVADHDPAFNAALEAMCSLVDVDDNQDITYELDLVTDQISNLKIELVNLD